MNHPIWNFRCSKCKYETSIEYIFGKTPAHLSCPNDGWQLIVLQEQLSLCVSKETLKALTTAVRDALANEAFADNDKGKKLFKNLNWVMNSFEDETRFLKIDENGFTCNSVSLEG